MSAAEPVQEFFTIGEVCELTELKPHVLRYWESQFRFLNPAKNRSGNRVYQRREIELIILVKHLLYPRSTPSKAHVRKWMSIGRAASCAARAAALTCRRSTRSRAELKELVRFLATDSSLAREADEHTSCAFSSRTTTAFSRTASSASSRPPSRWAKSRRRARPRAERHQPLAHAAPSAAPVRRAERRWQVDGTPTDCVMLAVEALLTERPDFVLSGINHGQNMGEDVLYSGTVAAAMEGLALGIPSIAFSFAGGDLRADSRTSRSR